MSDPRPTDPLALGARIFDRWRERRPTADEPVPAPLRSIACLLLDVESPETVARACHVTPATLERWRRAEHDPEPSAAAPTPSDAFVALAPSAAGVASVSTPSVAAVTVERPDGLCLHLHGPLAPATVADLAALLEARCAPEPAR